MYIMQFKIFIFVYRNPVLFKTIIFLKDENIYLLSRKIIRKKRNLIYTSMKNIKTVSQKYITWLKTTGVEKVE